MGADFNFSVIKIKFNTNFALLYYEYMKYKRDFVKNSLQRRIYYI